MDGDRPIGTQNAQLQAIMHNKPLPQKTRDNLLNIDDQAHRYVRRNIPDNLPGQMDPNVIRFIGDKGVSGVFGHEVGGPGGTSHEDVLRLGPAIQSGSYSNIFDTGFHIAQEKTREIAGDVLNPTYGALAETIPGFDDAVKNKIYDPNPVRELERFTGMHALDYLHNWELLLRPDKIVTNMGKFVADDAKGILHAFGWLGDQLNKI